MYKLVQVEQQIRMEYVKYLQQQLHLLQHLLQLKNYVQIPRELGVMGHVHVHQELNGMEVRDVLLNRHQVQHHHVQQMLFVMQMVK